MVKLAKASSEPGQFLKVQNLSKTRSVSVVPESGSPGRPSSSTTAQASVRAQAATRAVRIAKRGARAQM